MPSWKAIPVQIYGKHHSESLLLRIHSFDCFCKVFGKVRTLFGLENAFDQSNHHKMLLSLTLKLNPSLINDSKLKLALLEKKKSAKMCHFMSYFEDVD